MTIASFYIKDNAAVPNPLEGVVVSLLEPSTLAVVAQTETDESGQAGFDVPDATYEVRIFKRGYRLPVSQVVVDENEVNLFDITAEDLTSLPAAVDPRLCRCTGKFVGFDNKGRSKVVFRVMAAAESGFQVPKVVDGNLVFADAMGFQTDESGVVSIDLLRGGEYYVSFSGEDDVVWNIKVPDRPSVNLIDLIHPAPVSLSWDAEVAPDNEVTVRVEETVVVPVTMLFTDFETITEGHDKWVWFKNSDGTKIELGYSTSGSIFLKGLEPGTSTIFVELKEGILPSRVPPVALVSDSLAVTVEP